MTLPSYAVTFRGLPACPCQASWIPAFEAEGLRRGLITGPLSIAQLIGGAPSSGGTHTSGGASDFWPTGDVEGVVWLARQMGADATWLRPKNWDGKGGSAHVHSVLTGCPHNGPARYQIDAVRRGENGLANHGPDDGPRPLSGRVWQQGIRWARQQEDAVTEDEIKAIAKHILDEETVELRKADGSTKAITIRNALTRILNPDE